MIQLIDYLKSIAALRAGIFLLVSFPLLLIFSRLCKRAAAQRLSPQSAALLHKAITYVGFILIFVTVFNQLGYQLTTLLGAAGIAGVAIGFASQTSVSNIISGLFLISEKPFAVGDVIQVGSTIGTLVGIDLLSVKLRTFDNKLVRIPNENLIKTEVTNISRYPIRRFDIELRVAYKEDIGHVRAVLLDIATIDPLILDEPEPLVLFKNFGDSGLEVLFGVWFAKADFPQLRIRLMQEIKERFDAEGIEIPFPHRTLHSGSNTAPFPVRIVKEAAETQNEGESI